MPNAVKAMVSRPSVSWIQIKPASAGCRTKTVLAPPAGLATGRHDPGHQGYIYFAYIHSRTCSVMAKSIAFTIRPSGSRVTDMSSVCSIPTS